jgi:hypothetical protein
MAGKKQDDGDGAAAGPWKLLLRIVALLDTFVNRAFAPHVSIGAMTAVTVCYLGTIGLLPLDQRREGLVQLRQVLELTKAIVESSVIPWTGWFLAVLLLIVGGIFVVYQHGRIRTQGAENSALRKLVDQQRLSSDEPEQLLLYPERTRAKHEGN